MKPFLGIDLTENRKNETPNMQQFLVQETSSALTDALEASTEKAEQTVQKAKLPPVLQILQYVCGIAALIITAGILKADTSLAQGYQNAPWLYWIAGVCAVIWLILWLLAKQKSKTVLQEEESIQSFSHLEGVADAVYKELAVPEDAKAVDVLSFFYKVKDGEIKLVEKTAFSQYFNLEFKAYTDDENLYLVNLDGKFAFPLTDIKTIHAVKKHIRLTSWNKDEPCNKGSYKQYKLREDDYGCIHCNQYHIVEVAGDYGCWGIYIPSYELPVFEALI